MTSVSSIPGRSRDMQDMVERHVYHDIEYISGAGAIAHVKGTGTEDQEAPIIATGYGFRLKVDADAEVILFGGGSDTNLKFALLQLPHATQRQWAEGTGGTQNPNDGDHALEFKDGSLHLTKGPFTTPGGTFDVRDGRVYFRGDVTVTGKLYVNGGVITPTVTVGKDDNVPPAPAE